VVVVDGSTVTLVIVVVVEKLVEVDVSTGAMLVSTTVVSGTLVVVVV
jgi:hypothetical protein